jgi:hypothetical protein
MAKSRRRTPNALQIGHIQLVRIMDRTQEVGGSSPPSSMFLVVCRAFVVDFDSGLPLDASVPQIRKHPDLQGSCDGSDRFVGSQAVVGRCRASITCT